MSISKKCGRDNICKPDLELFAKLLVCQLDDTHYLLLLIRATVEM